MEITETRREDDILLMVRGRVDTNTSPGLQSRILTAFRKSQSVTLDLEEVDYISSAGLRALLIGEKTAQSKGGSMKVIHVMEPVLEVLEMSGFDKVLHIC